MAGIGPAPFCAMLLADLGAEVLRVLRPGYRSPLPSGARFDILARGRPVLALDIKGKAEDRDVLWRLIGRAEVLIEGFRPGAMERLGFGPDEVLARFPRLVYGRMTGWGQEGPLAPAAGHDLNYAALSGAIAAMGSADRPPLPPLNLVADFGGGGMLLAFGLLAALLEARSSGRGQVVDAAMVDGAALLMAMTYGLRAAGAWRDAREDNLLDGGAPFYRCYETADGKHVAVAALEPAFYALLLKKLGLTGDPLFADQQDRQAWPAMGERLTALFKSRPRDHWSALLEGSDACFAPVLGLDEAPEHPHNRAREVFRQLEGVVQPAPAPRFSRTPAGPPGAVEPEPLTREAALAAWDA
jgi:alpha-methylacyl-CoA racemase